MSQFQQLLDQLKAAEDENEQLTKSVAAGTGEEDDSAAAGAGGEGGEEDPAGAGEGGGGDAGGEGGDGDALTKSIKIGDDEYQVVDAEALVKSLDALAGRVGEQESVIAEGLSGALKLIDSHQKMIKSQDAMIKSLSAKVETLGNQGTGRKAATSLLTKAQAIQTPTSQQEKGPTLEEFMAKSEAAWKEGKLSGLEYTEIDVAIRNRQAPSESLIKKVLG